MKKSTRTTASLIAALGAGAVLALAPALAASAHVSASASSTAAGSYSIVTFSVPHGCDGSPTTAIEIDIPETILSVTPTVNPNWTITKNLVPLDTATLLESVGRTSRFFTVEENPRLCGWGAELASIVGDEAFWDLDGPIVRITTPHIPLPAAGNLEDLAMPSVDRIVDTIRTTLGERP